MQGPCIVRATPSTPCSIRSVIGEHLEAFLRAAAEAGEGVGLPRFVEGEFREFLMCGVFEHGFARFRREGCAREHPICTPTCACRRTNRAGVERLCRYVLRPPFAQERLRLRGDGRIVLELKRAWHDGTRELVFEPLGSLERLAAMTPRPETNLLICHGVLAPRARWRARVAVLALSGYVLALARARAPLAAVPSASGPWAPGP